jgi:hypothetical protein
MFFSVDFTTTIALKQAAKISHILALSFYKGFRPKLAGEAPPPSIPQKFSSRQPVTSFLNHKSSIINHKSENWLFRVICV